MRALKRSTQLSDDIVAGNTLPLILSRTAFNPEMNTYGHSSKRRTILPTPCKHVFARRGSRPQLTKPAARSYSSMIACRVSHSVQHHDGVVAVPHARPSKPFPRSAPARSSHPVQ